MKLRLLACLLVLVLAGTASARPVAAPPVARGYSWSAAWTQFLGFFQGFHLVRSRNASGHDLPPPCTTVWSLG